MAITGANDHIGLAGLTNRNRRRFGKKNKQVLKRLIKIFFLKIGF